MTGCSIPVRAIGHRKCLAISMMTAAVAGAGDGLIRSANNDGA
jgi:hypothetical protein